MADNTEMDKLKTIAFNVIGGGVFLFLWAIAFVSMAKIIGEFSLWLMSLGVPNFVAWGIAVVAVTVVLMLAIFWMEERNKRRYAKKE